MSYKVTVVEQPARHLVGFYVRTNFNNTHIECPALWGKFAPRMEELASVAEEGSFGASGNMENGSFDYWAAMAVPNGAKTPSDMSCLDVKGGKYAECLVENMADISSVYQYIYGEWGNTQNEYRVDFTSACLEFYRKDWREGDPVTLYVPLQNHS